MRRILSFLILGASLHTAHAAPPPAAAYAALPAAVAPRLSPDGRAIAMIGAVGGHQAIVVVHLDGSPPKVFSSGDWTPDWVAWKTPQTLLAGLRVTYDPLNGHPKPQTRMLVIAADGSRVMPVDVGFADNGIMYEQFIGDSLVSLLPADPSHVLLRTTTESRAGAAMTVSAIDLRDGSRALVQDDRLDTINWFADSAGAVRGSMVLHQPSMVNRHVTESIMARVGAADGWHVITTEPVDGTAGRGFAGFDAHDPDRVVLTEDGPGGNRILRGWRISTGAALDIVGQAQGSDVVPVTHDGALVGYATEGASDAVTYLDPAWARDAQAIVHALPNSMVTLLDRTEDGKHVLAAVREQAAPEDFWVLDRSGPKTTLKPVVRTYDDVPDEAVAPARWIDFSARDGLRIPAILTLPPGKPAKNLPFVVLPHGGPTAHDTLDFDWMAQFLASRGYGVLQPQFRGSTGFGKALQDAGLRQWGRAMQDDITDGTKYLIAEHLADPARIAIAGASFGGYAALEGVVRQPDMYRCAIAFAPVTDLPLLVGGMGSFAQSDLNLPKPDANYAELEAASPVNGVAAIRVPVMLVHGRQDFTVPVQQSERMAAALKAAGKPVETVYLAGSDHYLDHAEDRLAWLEAMDRFLARNLGPGL